MKGLLIEFISGGGIREEELTEFKTFLRDVAPYLQIATRATEWMQKELEKDKSLNRQEAQEAFTPMIQLTHSMSRPESQVQFHIRLTWDGQFFIDREEFVTEPGGHRSIIHVNQWIATLDLIDELAPS